jgi:uncharacterized protein (DUF58 family)
MKQTGWYFFILFFIIGIIGFSYTKAEVYYRLIVFCVMVLGISYVWAQVSLDGVEIKIRNRANKAMVGQVFDETAMITNRSWLPKLFLEVRDSSDLFVNAGSRLITWIGPGQTRSITTRMRLTKRGVFRIGTKMIRSGDPIGFFSKEKQVLLNRSLLVLPHFYEVQLKELSPQIIRNGKSIQKRSLDPSVQFSEIRNYNPGDDYKRIHWLSSKKLNKLMVKEFEQYLHNEYWILLDSSQAGYFFEPSVIDSIDPWVFIKKEKVQLPKDSFEYGVTIAATLCHQLLRTDRSVGLITESKDDVTVQIDTGARQEKKIFENLALISPKGKKSVDTVIMQNSRNLIMGSIVMIITTCADASLRSGLELLIEKKTHPILFVLDRETFSSVPNRGEAQTFLEQLKIPVCHIRYNCELKLTIETFFNSINIG